MPYAKTSRRAEQRALRDKMRGLGLDHRQIAIEFARRYNLRPRAAWRNAHGWSLQRPPIRSTLTLGEPISTTTAQPSP